MRAVAGPPCPPGSSQAQRPSHPPSTLLCSLSHPLTPSLLLAPQQPSSHWKAVSKSEAVLSLSENDSPGVSYVEELAETASSRVSRGRWKEIDPEPE